ncbi:glycosyltransferase family 9 protein [Flavobacteriaceae bacterium F89]|uniref:Glycosyltransferase family 9 protein n=2 Tax=Cerina litoralis TaxID=2874477 RepID=A0AAE3JPE2_9FLAO|nr:glycosyltransferase family 9 protein [Cerina litoralis]
MGDVAMTVPVLFALTKQYPQIKITVLTRGFFKPMFNALPKVEVFVADVNGRHRGFIGLWKLYQELKKQNFDGVADLHNVLRSNILKLFFGLGRIPFVQMDKGRMEKKALTSARDKIFKPLKTTHRRYADVFAQLGYPVKLTDENVLPKRSLGSKIRNILECSNKILIGIAPFAAFGGKRYPLYLMEEVIATLNKVNAYGLILFGGGPAERAQLEKWSNGYENCINLAGRVSFDEELDVISNLQLMLSMDSGNAHLAAMYGVPTVTLWGVTHPFAGFYPFAQDPNNALLSDRNKFPLIPTSIYGNKFPDGYENAMETIRPKDVVAKIEEVLDRRL